MTDYRCPYHYGTCSAPDTICPYWNGTSCELDKWIVDTWEPKWEGYENESFNSKERMHNLRQSH